MIFRPFLLRTPPPRERQGTGPRPLLRPPQGPAKVASRLPALRAALEWRTPLPPRRRQGGPAPRRGLRAARLDPGPPVPDAGIGQLGGEADGKRTRGSERPGNRSGFGNAAEVAATPAKGRRGLGGPPSHRRRRAAPCRTAQPDARRALEKPGSEILLQSSRAMKRETSTSFSVHSHRGTPDSQAHLLCWWLGCTTLPIFPIFAMAS